MNNNNDEKKLDNEKCCDIVIDEEHEDEYDDDELYRPRAMNSWKTLAPLFISKILKEKTDPEHPMLQKDIMERLRKAPYELTLERKAIGRVIHVMCDSGLGYVWKDKYGAYYDKEAKWY